MGLMKFINKGYFENDKKFEDCIKQLEKMKEKSLGKTVNFCHGTCCGNCVFNYWCLENGTLDMTSINGTIFGIADAFYDYFIPHLKSEYRAHKKNIKIEELKPSGTLYFKNDLKPSDSEGDKLQGVVPNNHYKTKIEPLEYIIENGFDFVRGNIIKYASRAGKKKGEEINDIKKIIDYALILAKQENINIDFEDIKKLVDYRNCWGK